MAKITDQRLIALAQQIKPLFAGREQNLYFMEPVDVKKDVFTHAPRAAAPAENLKEILKIHVPLSTQYPVMKDIYQRINILHAATLEKTVAFHTNVVDVTTDGKKSFMGVTTLYSGTLPASIKEQPVIYFGARKAKSTPQ